MRDDDGFTLIEIVAALAIVASMACLMLPILNFGSTPAQVDAYAVRIAALLKTERQMAIRGGVRVATRVNAQAHALVSGDGRRAIQIPSDIAIGAILAERCAGLGARGQIVFLPSGLSCGGTIALSRASQRAEIRVNWLTGGVEIVSSARS